MLYRQGIDGWHQHLFTITSAPGNNLLRFAIKAQGDNNTQLRASCNRECPQ